MSVTNNKLSKFLLICSIGAVAAGCGGGGGGGGSSAPATRTPDLNSGGLTGTGGGVSTPAPAPTSPSDPSAPAQRQDYAVLSWDAPTTNADGTCLRDLAGYKVSYGLSPGTYDQAVTLDLAEMSGTDTGRSTECGPVMNYTFLVENLESASWYFAVQAVDASGNASGYSNEVIKTVM